MASPHARRPLRATGVRVSEYFGTPRPPVLRSTILCAVLVLTCAVDGASGQSARDRRRQERDRDRQTAITESQATELTLTLNEVAVRPIQVWIRTAGVIDAARRTITAPVTAAEGARLRIGQRVRAFPPESRSSIYQARVSDIATRDGGVTVTVTLAGPGGRESRHYVIEIVTEELEALSVPNEAIIESEGRHIVYVEEKPGQYAPREIDVGLQGELYTEVRSGLAPGEQVVTFGSFFIDAEHKLREP